MRKVARSRRRPRSGNIFYRILRGVFEFVWRRIVLRLFDVVWRWIVLRPFDAVWRQIVRLFEAAWQRIMRRPLDSFALAAAVVGSLVIVLNALFLQSGRHPAPMLRGQLRLAASDTTGTFERMLPRPRPAAIVRAAPPAQAPTSSKTVAAIQQELARRGYYVGPPDGIWGPKSDAAMRAFAERAGLKLPATPDAQMLRLIARSPIKATPVVASLPAGKTTRGTLTRADAAVPSPRLMAVQRALADYGYGQIKPTGVEDAQTRAAIAAFERVHNLPPTGRLSDQLVRELSAMTGRPLE